MVCFTLFSMRYLGPVIWNSLSWEIKAITALSEIKESIKKWKPDCLCRIFKNYTSGVKFVNP